MATRFWTTAPSRQLIPNLRAYRERLLAAIQALGDFFAARIEAYAKLNAPWVDRTGAARQGLRAFTLKEGLRVVLYLVHSVFYGRFLEMGARHAAPRPIILPALEAHYAPIMADLRRLVGA